jgi:hypothetical protein
VGTDVVLRVEGERHRLIIRHERPRPEWLREWAERARRLRTGEPAQRRGRVVKMTEPELDAAMLALVRLQPGRARTHYERLEVRHGGVGCSQDRKEQAVTRLLDSGLVRRVELEKPVGRRRDGLWPVEQNSV